MLIIAAGLGLGALIFAFRSQSETKSLIAERADLQNRLASTQEQLEASSSEAESARALEKDNAALQTRIQSSEQRFDELRANHDAYENRIEMLQEEIRKLEGEKTRFETDFKNTQKELGERADLIKQASDSFKVLANQTLEQQRKSFMESADASLRQREQAVEKLVKPLSEKIDSLEKARSESTGELRQHIESLLKSNNVLTSETRSLSSALSKPQVRGQWGEMQVERALELSGLTKGIHYKTQTSDQQGGRTDFIVHMPHDRDIIIDSKVSLVGYLDAESATSDDERERHLARHTRHMRNHADSLASKEYQRGLPNSADFVVMVVPEFALPPAVERDPGLLDRALQKQVVICTHSTLVALLKCVAMGWQERRIADEALKIGELGRELHDRLSVFAGHIAGVGKSLETAVSRYNSSVGSFESRVMSQARKFPALGVETPREIPEPKTVDTTVRSLRKTPETALSSRSQRR